MNCLVGWADWLKHYPQVQLDLGRGLRFDRSFMSISAAADGMGVCLESTLLVDRELASAKLVMPFGRAGISVTGHHLVYPRESGAFPKVVAFRRWLQAQFVPVTEPVATSVPIASPPAASAAKPIQPKASGSRGWLGRMGDRR